MSSETMQKASGEGASQAHAETVHGGGHAHPSDRKYVIIAIILGVITAVEILFYYIEEDLGNSIVIPGLLGMMVVKFIIVAAFFMHLRFDSKLFTRLFVAGLVLAVGVYAGLLITFRYWGGDGTVTDERRVDGTSSEEQPVERRAAD